MVVSITHQRSGMRESRVRGGAASWPSLAAVAVCGGVQEYNLTARVVCEAWAGSPAIGHGPEGKGAFSEFLKQLPALEGLSCVSLDVARRTLRWSGRRWFLRCDLEVAHWNLEGAIGGIASG